MGLEYAVDDLGCRVEAGTVVAWRLCEREADAGPVDLVVVLAADVAEADLLKFGYGGGVEVGAGILDDLPYGLAAGLEFAGGGIGGDYGLEDPGAAVAPSGLCRAVCVAQSLHNVFAQLARELLGEGRGLLEHHRRRKRRALCLDEKVLEAGYLAVALLNRPVSLRDSAIAGGDFGGEP